MLKSFDYLDPNLAGKIHTLEQELKRLEQSKKQIMNNATIMPTTKNKLIQYQNQCYETTKQLLAKQKDKLVDYLDKQTNVITKQNRENQIRPSHKHSLTLNQSTRIDLSTDDSKSFEATSQSEHGRKVTSFYVPSHNHIQLKKDNKKYGNVYRAQVRKLKKKAGKQEKMIKMLTTWVKIYYQREQDFISQQIDGGSQESRRLKQVNTELQQKCRRLQKEINNLRCDFNNQSRGILETHRKCQKLREQNSSLQMERKELLLNARSLDRHSHSIYQNTTVLLRRK